MGDAADRVHDLIEPHRPTGQNAIRVLSASDVSGANGAVFRTPKTFEPTPLKMDPAQAEKLWTITTEIAARQGTILP